MQNTLAKNGQNILDVALAKCGDLQAAFDVALLNGLSLTDDLFIGQELNCPDAINVAVINYFLTNEIEPASNEQTVISISGGIGYWAIGDDFIIQ